MIGIIGAMQVEVDSLVSKMTDKTKTTYSGIDFFCGKLYGKDAVVAKSGIGKVFAAIAAQTMILKFGVSAIINTGVAGTLTDKLSVSDIAVSSSCVQHDMDTSALGDDVGLISGINIINIPADEELCSSVCRAAEKLGYRVLSGVIASGDCFVSSSEKKQYIKETFDAIACEMEGAAIAHVCYVNGVRYVVIRAISDGADGEAEISYGEFVKIAAARSADVVKILLEG